LGESIFKLNCKNRILVETTRRVVSTKVVDNQRIMHASTGGVRKPRLSWTRSEIPHCVRNDNLCWIALHRNNRKGLSLSCRGRFKTCPTDEV